MTEIFVKGPNQIASTPEEEAALLEEVYALESATWAPWLSFNKEQLGKHRQVFPAGQFEARASDNRLLGVLSTNRIHWSGDPDSLETWDAVAGRGMTYEDTFEPEGNTLALMSISINPADRGKGIYRQLIQGARDYAQKNGLQHLLGDFRPSGLGAYKRNTGSFDFIEYCTQTRNHDEQPQDPWLRAVKRLEMVDLRPDARAMVVPAGIKDFEEYMCAYMPERWWQVTDAEQISYLLDWHRPQSDLEQIEEVWECGETGTWYVDRSNGKSIYIESNLWGELPIRTARYDLTGEELLKEERKLVAKVKAEITGEEAVWNVWLPSDSPIANIVRAWEAKYFPEISKVVDDEVEDHSAFLAIVDTRNEQERLVHASRITGPSLARGPAADQIKRTYFAGIDELIATGRFTAEEFFDYYSQAGIDPNNCVGVETNMRVGKKAPKYNGVSPVDMAYLAFFRMVEKNSPELNTGGVFGNVNWISLRSFKFVGLDYERLLGRKDITYKSGGQDYIPVFLPYNDKNIELFGRFADRVPKELFL